MSMKNKAKILGGAAALALVAMLYFAQTVHAAPALLDVQPSRSAVGPGESVNISVRTNSQADYVFAMVDGVRFQGLMLYSDAAGNREWSLTVFPNRTTNAVVFANSRNVESGAAQLNLPLTVDFAAATVPPLAHQPGQAGQVPLPAPVGPIAIVSAWETSPIAQGMVQLTVVTGNQAAYVWVSLDGAAGGNAVQGRRLFTDATSSTWVIDYRPAAFVPHTVQILANRTFTWAGAETLNFNVALHQNFVPQANPQIQTVTVSPREVSAGGAVTIRVRTNADVGAVWVRDMDGIERGAWSIAPTTNTQRNWELTFTPARAGTVTVFANHSHTPWGAAARSEQINMRTGRATISTATAQRITDWQWGFQADTHIRVTTNRWAYSVWAVMPNRQVVPLHHVSGTGTANRVWEAQTWGGALPITIHAAEASGVFGGFSDAQRTINSWTGGTTNPGPVNPIWPPPTQPIWPGPGTGWPGQWPGAWGPGMQWPIVPGTWAPCGIHVYHGNGLWRNTITNVMELAPCGTVAGQPSPGAGADVAGQGWVYIQNGWYFNPNLNQSAWRGQGQGPPEWVNVHFDNRWYHMSRLGVMHPVAGGLPRTTTVVP